MSPQDRAARIMKRHRFISTTEDGQGFCSAPYCGSSIVHADEHEAHLLDVLAFAEGGAA